MEPQTTIVLAIFPLYSHHPRFGSKEKGVSSRRHLIFHLKSWFHDVSCRLPEVNPGIIGQNEFRRLLLMMLWKNWEVPPTPPSLDWSATPRHMPIPQGRRPRGCRRVYGTSVYGRFQNLLILIFAGFGFCCSGRITTEKSEFLITSPKVLI